MPEILLIPPTAEPVSLAEAKQHLRVTDTAQDTLISMMISAARRYAEMETRRQFIHARFKLVLDKFPVCGEAMPWPFARVTNVPGFAIKLPRSTAVDVVSVNYLDMASVPQVMDPNDYVSNLAAEPGLVSPGFGKIWPIPIPQMGAVSVTYDAGYASPMKVTTANARPFTVIGPVAWNPGDIVRFYNSGGALPAPLQPLTNYVIDTADSSGYTLKDMTGSPITFTDGGSGSNFIGEVPEGIRNWILIRVGSMYENREEVAVLNRGKVEELPFIDGLLDPYRVRADSFDSY